MNGESLTALCYSQVWTWETSSYEEIRSSGATYFKLIVGLGGICVRRPPTSLCKHYPSEDSLLSLYSYHRHWKQTGLVSKFITSSIPYLRGKTAAKQVLF